MLENALVAPSLASPLGADFVEQRVFHLVQLSLDRANARSMGKVSWMDAKAGRQLAVLRLDTDCNRATSGFPGVATPRTS
jgi:hypothetical protein